MAVCTARPILLGKGGDVREMLVESIPNLQMRQRSQNQCFTRTVTMFDAQIAVALFATFLLGMVAGSGMEIIVRGGRH
jgi:hypothetical protein